MGDSQLAGILYSLTALLRAPPALRREEDKKVGEWDPQALLPFLPPAGRICKLQDLSK